MSPTDLDTIIKSLENTVRTTVNGKVDNLTRLMEEHHRKHDADMIDVREHITAMKPVLEAYQGGKALGGLVRWVFGVGAAFIGIYAWITGRINL